MTRMNSRSLLCCLLCTLLAGAPAYAQLGPTFSVDFQSASVGGPGPMTGVPDFFAGVPLDEGSILTPGLPGPVGPNPPAFGPLPPPGMMVSPVPGGPGSIPGGLGIVPGAFGAVEVDALSYGRDQGNGLFFSVDEYAGGDIVAGPGPLPPNVFTEGVVPGTVEAAADVFAYLGAVAPTPIGPVFNNTAFLDGDGVAPSGAPGLGLIEPYPPAPGALFGPGDNLDAVDINTTTADVGGFIFFSMDSAFPDPIEAVGPPFNSGTAVGNIDAITGAAFSGGDVAVSFAGGVPVLYAGAGALGLDLVAGFDTDDLDALVLIDDGVIAPATGMPVFAPGADLILFSVRRGSAVVGMPDSLLGAPIEEGDVLTLPIAGGVSPFPSIFIPAEALGLGTLRSGTAATFFGPYGDDLDALDLHQRVPEPTTCVLLALGCTALATRRRT
ncbi:PEP-CTERM sorting domain-containing protein [Pirellulales bacterium]|nr:PEP-CTERM sorting domain-containing protein [Pirellulales bacterium]